MRGLRNAKDFLRVRRGVQERKCLACGKWKVEADSYTTQKNHGHIAYISRCKPCNGAHRKAANISASRQQPADLPPLPAEPPPVTWEMMLRWLT